MKKIAYFKIGYLPLSETFIYEQIRHIKRYRVSLICAKAFNLNMFPLDEIRCLSDLSLHSYLLNGLLLKFFNYSPYFADVIKKEKFALLHALFGTDGLRALPYKKKLNIPLITDFRGNDATGIPSKNHKMYKQLFEDGDLFLVRCESMCRDLIALGCPYEKILIHHSGIDVNRFEYRERTVQNGSLRLLFVGRLTEKKGAEFALRSYAEARKKYRDLGLTIIGDGPEANKLKKLIKSMDLNTGVHLLGSLSHERVIDEMMRSHILLLPSKTAVNGDKEGIPNVLMEAMATGMPVLSTFHAGIPELVDHGESGYLVPEGNQRLLTQGLLDLIEARDSWQYLGRNGRKKVEKEFNIIAQSERLERIYDTILHDRK